MQMEEEKAMPSKEEDKENKENDDKECKGKGTRRDKGWDCPE